VGVDEVPTLSLGEVVRRALLQGDRAALAQETVESAELSLSLARSAFRPKIVPNLLGAFGNSDLANQTYRIDLNQRFVTGTRLRASLGALSSQNQLGSFYSSDATLELSQPLLRDFGGGSQRKQLEESRSRAQQARLQHVLAEDQIALEVVAVYYRLVAQGRLVEVAEQGVERSRILVEASQAKQRVGRVSQLDVLRARRLLAAAEDELIAAQSSADDARDQLAFLMGEAVDFAFRVEPVIPDPPLPPSLEDAVALALQNRQELRLAQATLDLAERSLGFARNQRLPQLDLSLALTRRETGDSLLDSLGTDGFRFASFFTVSTPLDQTPQDVQYGNALIERDRRARDLRSTRRRIVQEVRRQVRSNRALRQRLERAEESVGFARLELEVAELRYQRGYSDNLDLVDAQASVLNAESTLVSVRAEIAVADVALRATMGMLDPRVDLAPTAPAEAP
jgi:outer membrane protein TolC